MTSTVKTDKRQKSTRKLADELLAEYGKQEQFAKETAARKKEIEADLLEMAERNEGWFDEGKTANFEHGQLCWKASSKVHTPENFDLSKFAKKFPHLVKVKTSESIVLSRLKVYLEDPRQAGDIKKAGVEIRSEDRFVVTPAASKP